MTSFPHPASLPLPRRLWWPWDQPAARVGFAVSVPVHGRLYVAATC